VKHAVAAVIGVPPRVEVVVRTAGIVGVEGLGLLRLGTVDGGIVARVGVVEGDFAVAQDEKAVDIAVLAGGNLLVELGQGRGVEAEVGRGLRFGWL
jgi:hypothetical protein